MTRATLLRMSLISAGLTASLALGACVSNTGDPMPVPPRDADDVCNATALSGLKGQSRAFAEAMEFAGPVRYLPPNSAMTLDYRADRLNIELDGRGKITRLFCG